MIDTWLYVNAVSGDAATFQVLIKQHQSFQFPPLRPTFQERKRKTSRYIEIGEATMPSKKSKEAKKAASAKKKQETSQKKKHHHSKTKPAAKHAGGGNGGGGKVSIAHKTTVGPFS